MLDGFKVLERKTTYLQIVNVSAGTGLKPKKRQKHGAIAHMLTQQHKVPSVLYGNSPLLGNPPPNKRSLLKHPDFLTTRRDDCNNSTSVHHTSRCYISSQPHIRQESATSSCQPVINFAYTKTYKTGSSTLATILYRYGIKHYLVAVLAPNPDYIITLNPTTNSLNIHRYNCTDFPGYNYIAYHLQYNRPALENVVLDAKYFTNFRSPQTRLGSHFYFFKVYERFPNSSNPFLDYLKEYEAKYDESGVYSEEMNSQFFRFGLSGYDNESTIDIKLRKLDKELDLVMLTEYYDESLVLLKKLMCWEFEDIVYQPMKVHKSEQPPITHEMMNIIRKVSAPEFKLYDYFNRTFWDKVKNYDCNFASDVAEFRSVQENLSTYDVTVQRA
ncbi:galactosylceramide sulfotransferase-like [Glandiceps talaboti]